MNNYGADLQLEKTGLSLPPVSAPIGLYKPCLVDGKYLYLSGHGPLKDDNTLIIGRIGIELTDEEGKLAARQVGLNMLATIMKYIGSLNKVKRVIKILGLVNCVPEFTRQPFIINGCSELFADIWGLDCGVGTRSAFGVGSLPNNMAVEIEAVFELV
jgi:enamine deaminase RidA (YjgF/YER057c/UK114 family)